MSDGANRGASDNRREEAAAFASTSTSASTPATPTAPSTASTTSPLVIAAFWMVVGVPLAWGVYRTLLQALKLFQ